MAHGLLHGTAVVKMGRRASVMYRLDLYRRHYRRSMFQPDSYAMLSKVTVSGSTPLTTPLATNCSSVPRMIILSGYGTYAWRCKGSDKSRHCWLFSALTGDMLQFFILMGWRSALLSMTKDFLKEGRQDAIFLHFSIRSEVNNRNCLKIDARPPERVSSLSINNAYETADKHAKFLPACLLALPSLNCPRKVYAIFELTSSSLSCLWINRMAITSQSVENHTGVYNPQICRFRRETKIWQGVCVLL